MVLQFRGEGLTDGSVGDTTFGSHDTAASLYILVARDNEHPSDVLQVRRFAGRTFCRSDALQVRRLQGTFASFLARKLIGVADGWCGAVALQDQQRGRRRVRMAIGIVTETRKDCARQNFAWHRHRRAEFWVAQEIRSIRRG